MIMAIVYVLFALLFAFIIYKIVEKAAARFHIDADFVWIIGAIIFLLWLAYAFNMLVHAPVRP